jgi:hypothetical protein
MTQTSLQTKKPTIEVWQRKDGSWIVNAHVSSVRIGETDRELVKKKDCVDYLLDISVFVGKSENDCKKWLDKNRQVLVKLGTPYEVA